ncbi:MAG: hypothetical protein BGO98_45785 [Myxococcales bacterium 68-20]|nr:protein kinase [Myxococcales bacterium]OJY31186.1 MAG: hypothetical protein BGO98_45785 [Myxococcales bacterium 68-20]
MAFRDGSGAHAGRVERKGSRDPLLGTVINGKFHVERAIARGGMGRIYYGTQAPLGRPVALKIVKADSVNEEESQFLKRFLLEASILAKLQHPNVVTLFDYGLIEGAPVEMYFIAMEYLNGETLTERLRSRGALPAHEALVLFRQIARGLREAHVRGIVHRDLKPSNIVIVPESDGEIVKLVDFGIGKDERGGEDLTRDGVLVGTPKYMAPEQFDGASSPASDVYALGIIVYQILTGVLPFAGSTMADFMIAKLQHPVPAMRDANPICDATDTLERLVYQMLARRPEERPTIDDVFGQLARCEEEVFGAAGARLGMSAPFGSHSVGAMLFPPAPSTMRTVPPMSPSVGTGLSSVTPPPGMHGAVAVSALTPRPMSTSARPPAPMDRTGVPAVALVALAFVLMTAGGVGLWLAKTRLLGKEAAEAPIASTSATTAPSAGSSASTAPASTPLPTSFVLQLDSTPTGARVTENGVVLGITPLQIAIERASVANGETRVFQLETSGYTTTAFAQGASDADVAHTVALTPETARTTRPRPTSTAGTAKPPATSPAKGPAGESDIRLKR